MKEEQYFGKFLRKSRLEAQIGLRKFAVIIGMKPSNLCNMEYGRISPPRDPDVLTRMANALGFASGTKKWNTLFDLSTQWRPNSLPPDVERYAATRKGIPVLLRTIENVKLTEQQIEELTKFVRSDYVPDSDETDTNP